MPTWRDYVRAVWGAFNLTLRGKTIPAPYPTLATWSAECVRLVDTVYTVAESHQLHEAARQAFKITLEGRPIPMQTILAAVRFNHTQEYPQVIRSRVEHHLTAIYAANLNDQFRVQKLAAALPDYPHVQTAVNALAHQLQAIPSTPTPQS
jgi:hypothetical protein